MKVLVRFKGDNDFGSVMLAFGNLLLTRVERRDPLLTPEQVARWFNELAPTLYEVVQNRGDDTGKALAKTRAYLHIKAEDVYVDAAADEKMKTAHEWANYDSVMVDGGWCRARAGEGVPRMKVSTTMVQSVELDARAVDEVFKAQLDSLCGGKDVYLNDKTGEVEEWDDTGHGSGITDVVDKKPSELKLAALKLRRLLDDARRAEHEARTKRRNRRTA